jgi:sugar phosphate isomerase/epimerase
VYVACSTMCFSRLPLEQALRMINELEFSKVDIAIHEQGPHLKPSEVASDVSLAAQRIRVGPKLTPAAFSVDLEAENDDAAERQLKAVCKLGRMTAVSVLTIAASPTGVGIDSEVKRLGKLTRLVTNEGLSLAVLTKTGTVTETPGAAIELCNRVPGLGLTLDPSHYIHGPHQGANFDEVIPYVKHVHLRDTRRGPGKFQVRIGQGEVEYGRIISLLERARYDRLLTVAIYDLPDGPFVMESEVRKLKFLLESLV